MNVCSVCSAQLLYRFRRVLNIIFDSHRLFYNAFVHSSLQFNAAFAQLHEKEQPIHYSKCVENCLKLESQMGFGAT